MASGGANGGGHVLRVHDAPSDHASAVELKTEMYRARVERDALQYQVTQLEVERDAEGRVRTQGGRNRNAAGRDRSRGRDHHEGVGMIWRWLCLLGLHRWRPCGAAALDDVCRRCGKRRRREPEDPSASARWR